MINAMTLNGQPISDYRIVYPKNGNRAEIYVAIVLQYHIYQKWGMILPTYNDGEAETPFEILIGNTNRGDAATREQTYSVFFAGKKLQAVADGYFGYLALARYLKNELFAKENSLEKGFSHTARYEDENIMVKRNGTHRVMFHNVWYHYISGKSYRFGVHNGRYELSLIMAYHPDVFGMNEFFTEWRRQSEMIALLKANGYVEAQPEGEEREMYNPVFYDPRRVKLIHCRYDTYGDLIVGENKRAIIPSERYYTDDSKYCWHSAVTGVFETPETGERFAVCNTHLESNTFVPNQTADEGDPLRAEQVSRVLIPAMRKIAQEYGVPVMVGGDYNSTVDRVACRLLKEAGFVNMRDAAEVKNETCSCHGYPVYNEELDAYVGGTHSCNGYHLSIDQIFALDTQKVLQANVYHTLDDDVVGYVSDHCPVLLDFIIKK